MIRLCVALLLTASAALAEPLDTAEKFERHVNGRTMFFHLGDGRIHASESYFSERRVRWSLRDGDCLDGEWYAEAGAICFIYENSPEPQCWEVDVTAGRLTARLVTSGFTIYEAEADGEVQQCLGPKVGV